ncbi:MAG: stage V sporulation protein S [Caldilineaceae bacterium]|nr:stage V sporulation protein S [Caldilineaceae bacterium]MCB0141557.1 stage V sporulation protein S [Caldilineaceae bacterium]
MSRQPVTPWRVSATTSATQLAGAIAKSVRDQEPYITLQAVGAGAVNQAIKSIAIARTYLAQDDAGLDLITTPEFTEVRMNRAVRTAIRFTVDVVMQE